MTAQKAAPITRDPASARISRQVAGATGPASTPITGRSLRRLAGQLTAAWRPDGDTSWSHHRKAGPRRVILASPVSHGG
jgi:hypothetical protein